MAQGAESLEPKRAQVVEKLCLRAWEMGKQLRRGMKSAA